MMTNGDREGRIFLAHRISISDILILSYPCYLIVCAGAILKVSTCLLWDITTEKSGLCQYAVCITQTPTLKSNKQ